MTFRCGNGLGCAEIPCLDPRPARCTRSSHYDCQFIYNFIYVFIKSNSYGDRILVKQLFYIVSFIFAKFILSFYLENNNVGKAFYLKV